MTHPLWLAQNLMTHPFLRAQNLVNHPHLLRPTPPPRPILMTSPLTGECFCLVLAIISAQEVMAICFKNLTWLRSDFDQSRSRLTSKWSLIVIVRVIGQERRSQVPTTCDYYSHGPTLVRWGWPWTFGPFKTDCLLPARYLTWILYSWPITQNYNQTSPFR